MLRTEILQKLQNDAELLQRKIITNIYTGENQATMLKCTFKKHNYLPLSGSCTMVRIFGRSITISC